VDRRVLWTCRTVVDIWVLSYDLADEFREPSDRHLPTVSRIHHFTSQRGFGCNTHWHPPRAKVRGFPRHRTAELGCLRFVATEFGVTGCANSRYSYPGMGFGDTFADCTPVF